MKIFFLCQGLNGRKESVGSVMLDSFSDRAFNKFGCLVAFVSLSSVAGLSEVIEKSKQHIKQFDVIVGIDQKGTSKEALEALLSLDIGTSIYYTFSPITFHPKIYLFEGDEKCRVIVGSSNLTKQGLFQNIEASIRVDVAKPDKDGEEFLKQVYSYLEPFFEGKVENLHKLTHELIEQLFGGGIIPDEKERTEVRETKMSTQRRKKDMNKLDVLKSLFPTVKIQGIPKTFKTISAPKKKRIRAVTTLQKAITPARDMWALKGQLLWKKPSLPASDVLYAKSGTNPTGGLRLTQARWKVNGNFIDQTTYFRQKVFGKLAWKKEKTDPYVEVSEVLCNVRILGEDKGQHRFTLRHKPSGEAGQGNYTTLLSWGKFGEEITKNDLRKKDFYLYASPKGQNESFYIEIKDSPTLADLFT